jgi:succinate-semialdehyde dehydrogenase/glutarate-semialdehyde dehydrogenase
MSVELTNANMLRSKNPANGQVLGEVAVSTGVEILARVEKARAAFGSWRKLTLRERLGYIDRFHACLMEQRDELAQLITRETGKPLIESYIAELFGPLETCRWLSKNAPRLLAPQSVRLNPIFFLGKRSYNIHEPLGVVAVISPWNYAFTIPVCTMLTALAAGNTVILKPSPKTPLLGKAIEKLFWQAGFPEGTVSVVTGDRLEAKTLVLSDVDRVVFTGSVAGGKAIMGLAAEKLHPVTLELGGKHPAIVLEDADVDKIAPAVAWTAFTNAGQACASIERLYVVKPLAEKLSRRVAELAAQLRLGDGTKPDVDVGPMIDEEQLRHVEQMVEQAVSAGARVLCGGRARRDLGGCFYEPTVVTGCDHSMDLIKKEIFGPVLPIIVVDNVDEAVALANHSRLALGASVWTSNLKAGEALAGRIRAGMVWVNDGLYSHACPQAPWGGLRDSGFGRTHSAVGLLDFVNLKHIGVDKQGARDWNYPYSKDRLAFVQAGLELCHGKGFTAKLRALGRAIRGVFKVRGRRK